MRIVRTSMLIKIKWHDNKTIKWNLLFDNVTSIDNTGQILLPKRQEIDKFLSAITIIIQ